MRLNRPSSRSPAWAALEARVFTSLSDRLDVTSSAPIAIALSGGGDSVALLLAAHAWAEHAGRPLICLTVDHGISPLSGTWTSACAERARSLGLKHRALIWTGAKPVTGRAAAARAARHRLMADAARGAGARVILVGHTADDRLEARVMRASGCSVPEPGPWSPSPAWPEGRGVFLLRPLLDIRRAAVRTALLKRGETWLDDPANVDPASLRARARSNIAGGGEAGEAREPADASALFHAAAADWAGVVRIGLETLRAASPPVLRRFLNAAVVCAAGGATPPRGQAIDRLWERMRTGASFAATLGGARIECAGGAVLFMRNDGAMPMSPSRDGVFDGRYSTDCGGPVFSLGGHMSKLCKAQREGLNGLPPAARRALPATESDDGSITCPLLDGRGRSLVGDRLGAACGAVRGEAAIVRIGETESGVLDILGSIERPVHEPA